MPYMNHNNASAHWVQQAAQAVDNLSKSNAFLLGHISLAIAWARSCTLTRIAAKLFALGTVPTVERRIQYFLANDKVDWFTGMLCLARWVLTSVFALTGRVVLLVDETSLQEHLKVMVVALAYRNRAIPLAWWCYPQDRYPLPQVELIDRLLGLVADAMPKRPIEVLVQADRGIGCSPELMSKVKKRGWYFLFRVQGSVQVQLSDGRQVSFLDLVDRPSRCFHQEVRTLKKAGWFTYYALGYWKVGQKEPWLLLSNCPQVTTRHYECRFWEEPAFKDLKSNGFNWQKSHVRIPEHANRLWLAMALAYVWVICLGTQALEDCKLLRKVARGKPDRLSVFSVGVTLLERLLHLGVRMRCGPNLNSEFLP